MKKFLSQNIKKIIIISSIFTLVFSFIPLDGSWKYLYYALLSISAFFGLLYIIGIGILCFCSKKKPLFDWHLINGSFLLKITAIVLSLPSILTMLIIIPNILLYPFSSTSDKSLCYSPKNLMYDENLYVEKNAEADTIYIQKCDKNLYVIKNAEADTTFIQKNQEDPSLYSTVYYHLIDPGNQHMAGSKSGRGWSALIAIIGVIFFNGLLVSAFVAWFDRRKEKWLKGEIKYKKLPTKGNHYVIIGGNDMVAGIVRQLLAEKELPYVLIQTSRDVEGFRRELFSFIPEEKRQQIIIYHGSRTSMEDISHLFIEQCKEIFILGEETRTDDIESYHDTMNMECLDLIYELCKKQNVKKHITCRVMFEYQTTFSVFQFYDIDKEKQKYIDFKPFNYYEVCAQKVLIKDKKQENRQETTNTAGTYLPLEGIEGIRENSTEYVHLFIVGMSRMGVAMAIEAAHLAHYPNYKESNKIRTKITFIDKNADEERHFFMGRFKELFAISNWRYGTTANSCHIKYHDDNNIKWERRHTPTDCEHLGGDFLDIEWEFIDGGIEHPAIQNYIIETTKEDTKITIAICLPESNRSHAAAMYLDKKIYKSHKVKQILVYNRYGNSIIKSLTTTSGYFPYKNKLQAFGMPDDCLNIKALKEGEDVGVKISNKYEEIKKLIKKAEEEQAKNNTHTNKTKNADNTNDTGTDKFKGKSDVAKKWSDIYNGNTIWTKLRCIGYNTGINNEDWANHKETLADVEHNRWNIEQLLMNFRPLTVEEQQNVINGVKDKEWYKSEMAHFDICSNKQLQNIDADARAYDLGLTDLLPSIYDELSNQHEANENRPTNN